MSSNQIPIPNITWGTAGEITLVNTTNGLNFKIFPRDDNTPYIFQELIINEDMFSESLSGSLLFNDPAYFIDQLNFTTFDQIKIKCTTPALNAVFSRTLPECIDGSSIQTLSRVTPIVSRVGLRHRHCFPYTIGLVRLYAWPTDLLRKQTTHGKSCIPNRFGIHTEPGSSR